MLYASKRITSQTTLTDTGLSVTIPANSFISLTGRLMFSNSPAREVSIKNGVIQYAHGESTTNEAAICNFSIYIDSETTCKLYAKSGSSALNDVNLYGYYIKL